jgi:hypothetical protein
MAQGGRISFRKPFPGTSGGGDISGKAKKHLCIDLVPGTSGIVFPFRVSLRVVPCFACSTVHPTQTRMFGAVVYATIPSFLRLRHVPGENLVRSFYVIPFQRR